jgi:hypothetical protein
MDKEPLPGPAELDERTKAFYLRAMDTLEKNGVPFLVGGAYSMAYHAGIVRHTKDFDVFVRRGDLRRAMGALEAAGYRTEVTFPHWLAKAFEMDAFVDVIFGSGNGIARVDDPWFAHAVDGVVLGRKVKLVPAEEVIWSKSFVQERERFDGADINHLILARGKTLNWERLVARFKGHERVLLSHVLLFGYAFPTDRRNVPDWVIDDLVERVRSEPPATEKVCRGTSLSRQQYLIDIRERGYLDSRLQPRGPMSKDEVDHWTAAIGTIR